MKDHSPAFIKLVDEAKTRIRRISIDDVKTRLSRQDDIRLIDVRERSEWEGGYIPGAQHLSKGVIERDIERKIPDLDAEIVLYCGGGYRSALVADALQRMGYNKVHSMDGGIRAWRAAGYDTKAWEPVGD